MAEGGIKGAFVVPGGIGLGWRPPLAGVAATRPLAFLEVVAESIQARDSFGAHQELRLPRGIAEARAAAVPVVAHGVGLGLGSTEPLDADRVAHFAAVAEHLGSPVVSEHAAFVGAAGLSAGHLLPLPRTRDALAVLAGHVRELQKELAVPLALEHPAALFEWPDSDLSPADFLRRLVDATGCLLLVDVANLHADAVNFGHDPMNALDQLPLEQLAYVHVAGGHQHGDVWHDSHAAAVPGPVLHLLTELLSRVPGAPVLLERDDRWPTTPEFEAELGRLERLWDGAKGPAHV